MPGGAEGAQAGAEGFANVLFNLAVAITVVAMGMDARQAGLGVVVPIR
jgi:hypothetical protein